MMIVLPVDCSSAAATTRPIRSDGPPGVFATTIFTGRSGYCAKAARVHSSAGAATPAASAVLMNVRRERAAANFVMAVLP